MSRISTFQSIATHRAGLASVFPHTPAASAIPPAHLPSGPVIVVVLMGIGFLVLVSRVNSVLVDLISQLVQVAAAVGRMLILILAIVVIAAFVLLHI